MDTRTLCTEPPEAEAPANAPADPAPPSGPAAGEERTAEVLRILRDHGPLMAGKIATKTRWATHGSDRALNDVLQPLRVAGRIRYIKGSGWAVVP